MHLRQLGRAHTAGDIVAWIPDAATMCTDDIVEYKSASYCGDCHFFDWSGTLGELAAYKPQVILPGRGDARQGHDKVAEALRPSDFVSIDLSVHGPGRGAGRIFERGVCGLSRGMRRKISSYAIDEHCFRSMWRGPATKRPGSTPRIWTAERDRKMWMRCGG
jgi:hypothetical protein